MAKKYFYIISFAFFGFLLQFLVHGLIETWYIGLLLSDFPKYGFGLSWDRWFLIHHILTVILLIAGVVSGFFGGKFWWKKLYEDKKTDRSCWGWKNRLFGK